MQTEMNLYCSESRKNAKSSDIVDFYFQPCMTSGYKYVLKQQYQT